jgi:hypothetical protein
VPPTGFGSQGGAGGTGSVTVTPQIVSYVIIPGENGGQGLSLNSSTQRATLGGAGAGAAFSCAGGPAVQQIPGFFGGGGASATEDTGGGIVGGLAFPGADGGVLISYNMIS